MGVYIYIYYVCMYIYIIYIWHEGKSERRSCGILPAGVRQHPVLERGGVRVELRRDSREDAPRRRLRKGWGEGWGGVARWGGYGV